MTGGIRGVDPDAVRVRPDNEAVVDRLGVDARPAGPDEPYAIDAFVLRTHPDLVERLLALASGLPGVDAVGVYGVPCLLDDAGVIRAMARGTSSLWLRLPAEVRAALLAEDGREGQDMGPDWLSIDAWQTVLPFEKGTARLRGLLAEAFGRAAGGSDDAAGGSDDAAGGSDDAAGGSDDA